MEATIERIDASTRHPDFDEYWERYHRLVYWWARKLERRLGLPSDEVLGTLVLRFNYVLHHFDESKGSFGNLFQRGIGDRFLEGFLRFESEGWHVHYLKLASYRGLTSKRWQDESAVNYAYHDYTNRLFYSLPQEDSSEIGEFLDCFPSGEECWDFMTRNLDKRDKFILRERFESEVSLVDIGNRLGVTKQRVQQIEQRALGKVRERLRMIKTFVNLFKTEEE